MDENEGTHTVLVAYVDDSWGGRELARRVLEKHGHLSLLGADGSDAVSLRFGDPEPDAMFINGQMTYMPGPKAIEIIREREAVEGRRRMPIALETAWAEAPEIAARCGADAYLFAPWDTSSLLATLYRLLAGRVDGGETGG